MAKTSMTDEQLEKTVLEHLDVLYAVAYTLTKDKTRAETLVQRTVSEALYAPETLDVPRPKGVLLSLLRSTFLSLHDDPLRSGCGAIVSPLCSCCA